eukprot:CAMPEP_0174733320 /NCGR_PEP_ID=MMETSP1094-20130205/61076_1 /TAXON_ID=156173 /ORGANISM="Chrysochromulina brevifilum, Strain UTEX LB 985" /LENGTH=50 /DNA_ID=CAMNT_0015935963 /DNA_START=331 /DNA_END=480 /DNA_ORIENTATION=+
MREIAPCDHLLHHCTDLLSSAGIAFVSRLPPSSSATAAHASHAAHAAHAS